MNSKIQTLLTALTSLAMTANTWAQGTPPTTFPADAQTLSPQALQERLAGKRFTTRYANGMTATMSYGADQAIQMDLSSGLSARGRWRVDGSQVCFQFQSVPSGCSEVRATASLVYMLRYTSPEVIVLQALPTDAVAATTSATRPVLTPVFHAVPTDRPDVTMNMAMLQPSKPVTRALLVVPGTPGSEGRIAIENAAAAYSGKLQYLSAHADLFDQAGIALVAMGCPTDQWARFGQCDDDYRKSVQYVADVSKVMDFLRQQHGIQDFWVFGHSSGGISSRWLALNMPDQLKGAIHSSAMNATAGNLARTMVNFDMKAVQIPMLHIAHEQDECPSTLYAPVKRYAKDNLVTVRGGGQSGPICGGSNRHSFEGRQRGVSKAIVQWISTGRVQPVVDTDE